MKFRLIFIVFIFAFPFGNASATDTTLLYKQRLQQIKKFSTWLESNPNGQLSFTSLDTNSSIWKTYDTAFTLFFDKQIMDSLFQINTQVLAASAKYQMLKIFISGYDNLVDVIPFDSIQFKTIRSIKNDKVPQGEGPDSPKMIILYFLIDRKEYEMYGFSFAENSAKLTGITDMGGDENRNKIVQGYINRISTAKQK